MASEESSGTETKSFILKLEGAGLSFETAIDGQQVASIMALALGSSGGAQFRQAAFVPPNSLQNSDAILFAPGERVSLREFLDASEAKRLPEKILSIALYLEQHEQQPGFSRDDIKGRFRNAGEAPPGNFPRDFGVAVSSGWIAEDHANKGTYYVTKTGKGAVGAHFASDVAKTQRRSSRRRRSPRSAGGASEE